MRGVYSKSKGSKNSARLGLKISKYKGEERANYVGSINVGGKNLLISVIADDNGMPVVSEGKTRGGEPQDYMIVYVYPFVPQK
jgi:hypothetical protein